MQQPPIYKGAKERKHLVPYPFALALLIAAHIAGLIGLQTSFTRTLFLQLVPFNLLLTALILFGFHKDWSKTFLLFAALAFAGGFLTEVAGVHTGLIFGSYRYGTTLGLQLFQVPLLIGLNWLVLIYSIGIICQPLNLPIALKAAAGSALMVMLDVFIEQVAIRNDFWTWQHDGIPIQNYIGWFATSYVLFVFFHRLNFRKSNPMAKAVFLVQLFFFVVFCFIYLLNKEITLFA